MFISKTYYRQYNNDHEIENHKEFYKHFSNTREFGGAFTHFDHLVKNRFMNIFQHTYNAVLRKQPNRIIDIGCGAGVNLPLGRLFPQVEFHGIDYAEKAIQASSAIYPEIKFHIMDAFNLNFEGGHFDLAILSSVVILYKSEQDRIKLLTEAARVLNEKGVLICILWNDASFLRWSIRLSRLFAKLRGVATPEDFLAIHLSEREARRMFALSPFELEEVQHTGSLYGLLEMVRYLNLGKYRRTFGAAEREGLAELPQNIKADLVQASGGSQLTRFLFRLHRWFPRQFAMYSFYVLRKKA